MIEAGIIAVAILIVGIAGIVVYRREQKTKRRWERESLQALDQGADERSLQLLERVDERMESVAEEIHLAATFTNDVFKALAPLCESLAESLTARMSTIDADMADLRTRVETGPGKRTLRV